MQQTNGIYVDLALKNQDAMIAAYEISFTWTINEWPESGSVASFAEP